jgi:hypothetical protein
MAVAPSSALYYPTIDIQDESWLRTACLFWEHIRTIAPESSKNIYSSRFAKELNDEGIIYPIRVNSEMQEIRDLTDEVLAYITDPDSDELISWEEWEKKTGRSYEKDRWAYLGLNANKLPSIIREQFRELMDENGNYRFEPDFSKYYMTLLATHLSRRLGLGLVTNSKFADRLGLSVRKGSGLWSLWSNTGRRGRDFDASGPRQNLPHEVTTGMLVEVAVQTISVRSDISIKEIILFRREHAEELSLFRGQVNKLASEIAEDAPIEALRQAVKDQYKSQIMPALKSLRRSMALQRWDTALNGLLKVSLLSVGPTSAAITLGVPASIALLAAAGVSITASAVTVFDQRRKLEESPYSYLIAIEGLMQKSR